MSTLERQVDRGWSALAESVASIVEDPTVDKADALAETMGQAEEYFLALTKSAVDEATGVEQINKSVGSGSYDKLMALATELRKAEPKLSQAQAFAKVYTSNPRLARQEREERRGTVTKSAADRLAGRAAAVRKLHPNTSAEDAIAMVKARNPELVDAFQHDRAVEATDPFDIQKGGTSVVANRVHARAAALVRQFPNMTVDEAIDRVLRSNPEMAASL